MAHSFCPGIRDTHGSVYRARIARAQYGGPLPPSTLYHTIVKLSTPKINLFIFVFPIDNGKYMCYNQGTNQGGNTMKVWCFNCYGICIARLPIERIDEWNRAHYEASAKIKTWKE